MDPWNPGQFYACCGLVELLNTESHFALDKARPRRAEFIMESDADLDLNHVLHDLRNANYTFDPVGEKSVWPVSIDFHGRKIQLDWWLDVFYEKTHHLKCWAGQVTTGKLIEELREGLNAEGTEGLFLRSKMMKSKFGIDPRSAWNSLGVGFSPNEHGQDSATFPAVEFLGAIGLQGFRPDVKKRDSVNYFLWQDNLPRLVARRAARAPWDGLAGAAYCFEIAKRGQSYKFFNFGKPKE